MKLLFVDTGAFAAMADSRDDRHKSAAAFGASVSKQYRLLTTNYVLDELYTLLLMNAGYRSTLAFKQRLDLLTQAKVLRVVWISEGIADLAWTTFERFNTDKLWSFTDCTSFAVMQEFGLTEAFTFDRHFAQMGFTVYPS